MATSSPAAAGACPAGVGYYTNATCGAAVDALGETPAHVFLTVGRLSLGAFKRAPQHSYVARSIDQPDASELPPRCRVLLARPPFALADERALMQAERFDFLCTKNSGGAATR